MQSLKSLGGRGEYEIRTNPQRNRDNERTYKRHNSTNDLFYERLSDMGYPMSLHNLDSITAELLIQNGLGKQYYIYIINLRTGEKLNGIGTQREPSFMAIKPKYFPIRSDYTQVVQLIITNPNKTFLERMGLLIVATIIIMVFVIGSITYQIKS